MSMRGEGPSVHINELAQEPLINFDMALFSGQAMEGLMQGFLLCVTWET